MHIQAGASPVGACMTHLPKSLTCARIGGCLARFSTSKMIAQVSLVKSFCVLEMERGHTPLTAAAVDSNVSTCISTGLASYANSGIPFYR